MVIRILTGKDIAGAIRYNECKVEQGQADRLQIMNYPGIDVAERSAHYRLQLLEQHARLNRAVRKPSVHLAIAFHPSESLTRDRLKELGNEVMTEAGYGKQPYLMYQHFDTHHPHIHVVTVAVDAEGAKISDQFIKNRLQQIRRRMEVRYDLVQAERTTIEQKAGRVGEGLSGNQPSRPTLSTYLNQTLKTFSFGSVDSLKHFLASEGIVMNTKAGRSQLGTTFRSIESEGADNRPVRASSLPGRPTLQRLTEQFADQAGQHHKRCEALGALLRKRLATFKNLTELDYKQSLHQLGIKVIAQEGTYLYVHKRAGLVAQEDELGKPFYRQTLLSLFSGKTEKMPTVNAQVNDQDKKPVLVNVSLPATRKSRPVVDNSPVQNQSPIEIAQRESVTQRQNSGQGVGESGEPTTSHEMNVQLTTDRQDQRQSKKKQKKNRPRPTR